MAAITWTDALALQQPRMDLTHREFVGLLNDLQLALEGDGAPPRVALAALVEHTEAHFAQEGRWMARLGFAAENCHGRQHEQVLEVMREVQRRFLADGELALVRELVPSLVQWFPRHAQTMDAALALTMEERGFDPDAGESRLPPPGQAARIAGCGGASRIDPA